MSMNCSHYDRLLTLLQGLLIQLNRTSTNLGNLTCTKRLPAEDASQDAYLYILLIMAFYAFLAGGLILAYTRSRRAQSEEDPYTNYIRADNQPGQQGQREKSTWRTNI